jgi:PmbA protein
MKLTELKSFLSQASQLGAKAEIFVSHGQSLELVVSNGKLESLDKKNSQGVGIRALVDKQMGFAFSTEVSKASIEATLKQAVANAEVTAPDEFNTLPEGKPVKGEVEHLVDIPIEEKIQKVILAEKVAKEYDSRIIKVQRSAYGDATSEVMLVSTEGVEAEYKSSYYDSYVVALAEEDGQREEGVSFDVVRNYEKINFRDLGEEAADKAVSMLGARPISSEKLPLILDREIAAQVLSVLANVLSARSVIKKKSLFAEKVGQKVASHLVTIIDDGNMKGGVASNIVDDEGVPTQRTVLVDSGILLGFYHNSYTANRMGVTSTGNGVRSGAKSTVGCGTTNLYIQPGQTSKEEMIDSLRRGLMVTSVMGLHTANPISGDFSLGAAGFLIQEGKIARPVRGITIAGNLIDLLSKVTLVGSDLRMFGSTGAPTLLVDGISVSGE